MATPDTKTAILDTAERLFAQNGFESTSLRAITGAAGANIAAVSYHFGSKDELAKAVLARHIEPLNARRLELLEQARDRAGEEPIPLEEIVRALVVPALDLDRGGTPNVCRLIGRIWGEQPTFLQELIQEQFAALAQRFLAELARALPHVERRDLFWRMHFLVGALVRTLQWSRQLETFSGGLCRADDVDHVGEALVAFACAGMRAQSTVLKEDRR